MADDEIRISGSLDGDLADALGKLNRQVDDVEESLDDMGEQATATGRAVEAGTAKATEGLKRTEKAAEGAAEQLDEVDDAAERAARNLAQMTETNRRVARSLGLVVAGAEKAEESLDDTAKSAGKAARALDEAGDEAAEAGVKAAAASTGWGKLDRAIQRNERLGRMWSRMANSMPFRFVESGMDRFGRAWDRINNRDWKGLAAKVDKTSRSFGRFRYALMLIKFVAIIGAIKVLLGLFAALGAGAIGAVGALGGLSKGLVAFAPVALTAALAMKAFSLAAEALAPELDSIKKRFEGLGEAVARGDLRQGLRNLNADMEGFAEVTERGFERIGAALGRGASRLGQYLKLQSTLAKVDRIFAGMQPILDNLVDAALNLAAAFVNVLDAAMPVGRRLAADLEQLTFKFRIWSDQASASGEMTEGIDRGYSQLVRTVTTLSNFMVGLYKVFQIAAMEAGWMGDGIESASTRFKEWTQSFAGGMTLRNYFRDAMPAVKETLLLIRDVMIAFADLATKADLAPMIARIRTELLPVLSDLTGKIALDLGPKLLDLAIALGKLFGGIDTSAVQVVVDMLVGFVGGIVWLMENVPGATFVISALVTALLLLGPLFAVIGWGVTVFANILKVITFFRSAILSVRVALALLALSAPGFWAMITGPIGIAVAVVAALVAAFIWAYNNVEWFRNGVNAALSAVGGFFTWLWQDIIVPAWDGIVGAIAGAWNNHIFPVLNAIWTVIKVIGAVIFTLLVAPWVIAWNLLTSLFAWAGPLIGAELDKIGAAVSALYVEHVQPIVDWIVGAWNWLMDQIAIGNAKFQQDLFMLQQYILVFYYEYIKPHVDLIVGAWNWLMEQIQIGRTKFEEAINAIGAKVSAWWLENISPIANWIAEKWNWLMSVFTIAKQNTIDPIFDGMGEKLEMLKGWFRSAVDTIGIMWAGLKNKLAVPVNFLIDHVWNRGVLAVWNWVAEKIGLPTGQPIPMIPEFRAGGPVRGAGTGTSDSMVARVSNGEHMWTADEVDAAGGHQEVMRLRRMAKEGRLRMAAYALGGPITPQDMHNTVRGALPGTRMTSSYRAGDRGWHGKNRAADLAGPRSMDTGYMRQIDEFIGTKFPGASELIYTPGPYNIKDGRATTYSAGVRADHYDHVHWANNGASEGSGGGIMGAIAGAAWDWARPVLDGMIDPIINGIPFRGPPQFMDIPKKMATTVKDNLWGWVEKKINEWGGGGGAAYAGAAGSPEVMAAIQAAASKRGWGGGGQWSSLLKLIQGESGFNPNAQNPTSTAFGLFQFLNSTWGTVGGSKTSNPALQSEYGMRYIGNKYGNPSNAYAKWSSRSPHWYDDGGYLEPGLNLVANGTGAPEPVFTSPQWGTLSGLLDSTADMVAPVESSGGGQAEQYYELMGAVRELAHAVANQKPPTAVYGEQVALEVAKAWRQARREEQASSRYSYAGS